MIIFFTKKFTKFKILIFIGIITITICNVFSKDLESVSVFKGENNYMAVVIDDFGYNGEGTKEILSLDLPLTVAILPFSENSEKNKNEALKSNKEVIIHLPMEAKTGDKSWLGENPILVSSQNNEIKEIINEAFEIIDCAVGLNNHMGSAVMEDERILNVIFDEAYKKDLYFLDSKTTQSSLAKELSHAKGVFYLERDIFLDSTNSINVVKSNLKEAAKISLNKGYAIAIGHVGPEGGEITAKAIEELAPEIKKLGIEFVTLSQLVEILQEEDYGN